MPLLHSNKGKIKALLLFATQLNDIAIAQAIAEKLDDDAVMLLMISECVVINSTEITTQMAIEKLPKHVYVQWVPIPTRKPIRFEKGQAQYWKNSLRSNLRDVFLPIIDEVMPVFIENDELVLYFSEDIYAVPGMLQRLFAIKPIKDLVYAAPKSEYYFPGGDIICADDFFLIGPQNTYTKSHYWQNNWNAYCDGFRKKYHYPVDSIHLLRLDGGPTLRREGKLYHLDLYLTYCGTHQGRHRFIIGDIANDIIEASSRKEELVVYRDQIIYIKKQLSDFFEDKLVLDYIPLLPEYDQTGAFIGFYSHNNVLMEITEEHRTVYMPHYTGTYSLDYNAVYRQSLAVFNKYFDTVHKIDIPMEYLFITKMSLHCFAAPLLRQ